MAAVFQEAALLPTDPGEDSFSSCAYAHCVVTGGPLYGLLVGSVSP